MRVLKGSGGEVVGVRFTPDGRGLFAARTTTRGTTVTEHWPDWSAGGKPAAVPDLSDGVSAADPSPDGRHVLAVRDDYRTVVVHDRTTGADAVLAPGPQGGFIWTAELTPDGQRFIAAHGDRRTQYLTCTATAAPHAVVWNVRTAGAAAELVFAAGGRFVGFEQTGDGRGYDAVARDAATGEPVGRVYVPCVVQGLTASPDGRLVVGQYAAKFLVYQSGDLSAGPVVVPNTSRKGFTGVAFHPSGGYLAATSNDATVKLFDTTTWGVVRTFDWDVGRLRSVAFSPDGNLAAAGGDKGQVVVWDFDV